MTSPSAKGSHASLVRGTLATRVTRCSVWFDRQAARDEPGHVGRTCPLQDNQPRRRDLGRSRPLAAITMGEQNVAVGV